MKTQDMKKSELSSKQPRIRISSLRKLENFNERHGLSHRNSISQKKFVSPIPRKSKFELQKIQHTIQQQHINRIRKSFMTKESKGFHGKTLSPISNLNSALLSPKKTNRSSTVSQYETFLKVSAESWLVFDYRRDTYTRGWRVSEKGDFSAMMRFLLLKVFDELLKKNSNLLDYQTRVNTKHLREQIEMTKEAKKSPEKRRGIINREIKDRCFPDNTIAKLRDIFYALFMTRYEDIVEYMIITLGYLIECEKKGVDAVEQNSFFFVDEIPQAITYKKYFCEYVNDEILSKLQMFNSQAVEHFLHSTPNDMCRLFLSVQSSQLLQQIVKCKQMTAYIKYQMGFKYWENRKQKLKNTRIDLGSEYWATFNWQNKVNYSGVSRNLELQTLIILGDCKYGMVQHDVRLIEQWVHSIRKPIVDMRKTHLKLLPVLRVKDSEQEVTISKKANSPKDQQTEESKFDKYIPQTNF